VHRCGARGGASGGRWRPGHGIDGEAPVERGMMAGAWTGACRWQLMGRGGSWHSHGACGGANWTRWRPEASEDNEVLSHPGRQRGAA
jgi:hypothetical protein